MKRLFVGDEIELPSGVRRQYPELAAITLRQGGIPPRIGGWLLGQRSVAAITLWRTIYLGEGTSPDLDLLLHELRHVEQFGERKAFPLHYIWQSVRYGYHRNRYEVDAREYASRRIAEIAKPDSTREA